MSNFNDSFVKRPLNIQIKHGLPCCVTCPSVSMDPGSLNPGTRRSRVLWWWDPRNRKKIGASDTVLAKHTQSISYHRFLKLFPYSHWVPTCMRELMSRSWKYWLVTRSTAHQPLLPQPLLLFQSMTLATERGLNSNLRRLMGLSSSFPINYTCYWYTADGKNCTLCVQLVWLMDGANWHEVPWKPGLFTFCLWSGHCIQLVLPA